ncbi:glycoside hydrolase family 47 protein [Myriangium duriaei CBS 260.36]|uniref:alpha-1,2-Mannosidase n=1 Tax=Myriangium duriaei CBS 260.36 TaxID=1168546 RepID=A0A9P4IXT1_9PEZI|nr:glycoside hydrolase family 47 protein [Myriangium duriaei CBS 260.36]
MHITNVTLLTLYSLLAAVHGTPVPPPGACNDNEVGNDAKLAAVKSAFTTGFKAYEEHAFGFDELLPVSNGKVNDLGGWGATLIDSLSTAIIMQMPDVIEKILDFVPKINYGVTADNMGISLFETTIRHLAGLLSAFDLLKHPRSNMALKDTEKIDVLLTQATHLANNLSYAFETKSGIPQNGLNLHDRSTDGSTTNSIAGFGSLVLEWTRLSDLTGNDTYGKLTQKAESYLLDPQPPGPWNGLLGTNVNVQTGRFEDASGGWDASDDSAYEYMIKMYAYDSHRFESYKDRWVLAADSTMEHLASHSESKPELTFLANFEGTKLKKSSSHLACFAGGNFIFGGLVLGEQKYTDFGLKLVEACEQTYSQTLTGIGPEGFSWAKPEASEQQAFYEKAGFYSTSSGYILRPEVLESFYYAYQATGNQKYRDWSWNAFSAIVKYCGVQNKGSGFAGLRDVTKDDGGGYIDNQPSFFFAETLKYAYLIHAPDADYQVKKDKRQLFVFNTEAHPLKVFHSEIKTQ